ncbi:MAG TPA: acyl-CoA dehydrogenase family protein, partial [Gaiellaceae bacterium]|nr:acyl-CoA dehydrogenase family protein [Gaiellaceae bacterium]
VEHAASVTHLAVVAAGPALAIVDAAGPGVSLSPQRAFDATAPVHAVELSEAPLRFDPIDAVPRLATIGALLAAAEAVGAAGRMLDDACAYATERRQFGRPIGSFQALRHLLADLYVRQVSSWSSVLYAAAALDERADDAARTASIAKAYVGRAAREVAHGAMQVFGGIAMTAEHPAHRFLRRVIVRERQFGDPAHHERALGRALAAVAVPVA